MMVGLLNGQEFGEMDLTPKSICDVSFHISHVQLINFNLDTGEFCN